MRARVLWMLGLCGCGGEGGDAARDAATSFDDAGVRGDAAASDAGDLPDTGTPYRATCGGDEQRGEATYYDADGSGNCSFDPSPGDLMVAAMNDAEYAGSAVCGACVHVQGPDGEVTVRIVDRCPECARGDLDLSPQAFDRIAPRLRGRVPVSWRYVACAVQGPVRYRFKEGSSQWWTAVQVRNHQHAIAKLEVERAGAFVAVERLDYDYFVDPSGMGPGPYTFRLTDVHGGQLVDRGIALRVAAEVSGAAQLPACTP